MVPVVPSENRREADSLCTSVTVPKWNPRSCGFRLSWFAVLWCRFRGLESDLDLLFQEEEGGGT